MKRMVSGIKPTGELTLGNYLGAIQNFVKFQDEYELFVFVADLHALTTIQDRAKLRKRIKDVAAFYLACGLDKEKIDNLHSIRNTCPLTIRIFIRVSLLCWRVIKDDSI
jgi:tryptophanyl-tRNA synthetase